MAWHKLMSCWFKLKTTHLCYSQRARCLEEWHWLLYRCPPRTLAYPPPHLHHSHPLLPPCTHKPICLNPWRRKTHHICQCSHVVETTSSGSRIHGHFTLCSTDSVWQCSCFFSFFATRLSYTTAHNFVLIKFRSWMRLSSRTRNDWVI